MLGFLRLVIDVLAFRTGVVVAGATAVVGLAGELSADVSRTAFHAEREAISEHFRVTGAMPGVDAMRLEAEIAAVLESAPSAERAGLLYDLGAIRRLRQDSTGAIESFEAAIAAAGPAERAIVFDAWIGTARAYSNGLDGHGAAAAALEQAVITAGPTPPRAMAHEIDTFAAEIESTRGDVKAALISSLAAGVTAETMLDRMYVLFNRGSIYAQFAERCDDEPLIDARTFKEEPLDLWGGCLRAIERAAESYRAARDVAVEAGWGAMTRILDDNIGNMEMRGQIIRSSATFNETMSRVSFDGETVLVAEVFEAGASLLEGDAMLMALIASAMAEADLSEPRAAWILGAQADFAGDDASALTHFMRAADLLAAERASYFDLRRTGMMTEDHPEVVRDLGLRLLNYDRDSEALAVFEMQRAQGMSELRNALSELNLAMPERTVIANLLELEARIDEERSSLVQAAIATANYAPEAALVSIKALEDNLHDLQESTEARAVLATLRAKPQPPPTTLGELEAAVRDSGVPVLLYWTTPSEVVVWAVSETGSRPRSVFLPQTALLGHVEKILRGTESRFAPFPRESARALHAFLIDPVRDLLHGDEVLIVPHGPLVGLPFEALVDPESGRYFVETRAVSYAPNVDFALRALTSRPVTLNRVAAIVDPEIATGEVDRLPEGVALQVLASDGLGKKEAMAALSSATIVHILLHGRFSRHSPLLSTLALTSAGDDGLPLELTAASLVAADWRNTRLAVLSACEGALVQARLSGELYGLSWPLLVGGANTLVLSRWRVEGTSNSDWIGDFYAELDVSGRPARAAAAAARQMIDRGREHPFFWAGPQVIGR